MTSQSDPGHDPQMPGVPSAPPTHPAPGGTTATIAPPDPAGDEDDMPLPKGRGPASTKVLVVLVLIAFAFLSGAWAQKKNDAGMIRPPKGPLAAMSGALGSAGGAPGGAGDPAAAAVAAAIAAGEKPVLAAAQLKGTIVSINGTEVTIKDANGVERKAKTSALSYIAKPAPLESYAPGTYVYVLGQPAADGSFTALAVVQDDPPKPVDPAKPGGAPAAPNPGGAP